MPSTSTRIRLTPNEEFNEQTEEKPHNPEWETTWRGGKKGEGGIPRVHSGSPFETYSDVCFSITRLDRRWAKAGRRMEERNREEGEKREHQAKHVGRAKIKAAQTRHDTIRHLQVLTYTVSDKDRNEYPASRTNTYEYDYWITVCKSKSLFVPGPRRKCPSARGAVQENKVGNGPGGSLRRRKRQGPARLVDICTDSI